MTAVTSTRQSAPATSRRWAPGWRIVARKELADHLLSVRFTALLVVLGIATGAAVYAAASALRDVAPEATADPSPFLRLFTVTADPVPFAMFTFVGFLAPLLGIAFGFDAVNGERAEGTLPRLVSQPIHRDDVINGKFVAGLAVIAMVLTTLTLLVAGFGIVALGVVPTGDQILRVATWLIVAVVYVAFWLGFATLMSVVTKRAATSALVSIAVWVTITLFAALLVRLVAGVIAPLPDEPSGAEVLRSAQVERTLAQLSPVTLYEDATTALLAPETRSVGVVTVAQLDRAVATPLSFTQSLLLVWPQLAGMVMLTVLCFGGAYVAFMRQEVRA